MIVILYPEVGGVHGIARYLDSFLAHLPGKAPPIVLITAGTPPGWQAPAGVELVLLPLRPHRLGLVWWTLQARAALARLERERGPALAVNLHVPPLIPASTLLDLGRCVERDPHLVTGLFLKRRHGGLEPRLDRAGAENRYLRRGSSLGAQRQRYSCQNRQTLSHGISFL